jgi:2-dehydro-3-deoxyphosphogluconate aldolase / (4S)-4-hydroxy-2-oxoglutarate aldolase
MTVDVTVEAIGRSRVVAVVRAQSERDAVAAAAALEAGGVRAVEVALTTPGGIAAIRDIRADHPKMLVGAGTVLRADDVTAAAAAGASFVVSPGFALDVIEAAARAGVLAVPGVMTPTEILHAMPHAPLLKLFPAGVGGPSLLQALRGPFPEVLFMPTGGVGVQNLAGWFAAGAFAVAAGTDLCPPEALRRRDYAAITVRARAYTDAVGAT